MVVADGRGASAEGDQPDPQHSKNTIKDRTWPPPNPSTNDDVTRAHRPPARSRFSNLRASFQPSDDDVMTDDNQSFNNNQNANASESCTDVIQDGDETPESRVLGDMPLTFVSSNGKHFDPDGDVIPSGGFLRLGGVPGETDVDAMPDDINSSSDSDDTDTCTENLADAAENEVREVSKTEKAQINEDEKNKKMIATSETEVVTDDLKTQEADDTTDSVTSSQPDDTSCAFDSLAAKYVRDINENETHLDSSLEMFAANAPCDSSSLSSLIDDVTLIHADVTDDAIEVSESRSAEYCGVEEMAKECVASASAPTLAQDTSTSEETPASDVTSTNNNNSDVKRPSSERGARMRENRKQLER